MPFDLPPALLDVAGRGDRWQAWVAGLPRLVRDLLDEWDLSVDGAPSHGGSGTALVVPVRVGGSPAVLKVAGPTDAPRHEALVLQRWHGRGAVQLLRADPRRSALLLERLGAADLTEAWDVEACEVIGGLYAALHVPAPPQLASLRSYARQWADELDRSSAHGALPRRVVEQAAHLSRALASDEATDGVLVHGDLHYAKVLTAERAPWLVIGPRAVSGDPHVEVAPLLRHRWDEVVASGDVRRAVRQRFHAVVDAAGLDEHRARDWVVVRVVLDEVRRREEGVAGHTSATVALVKAVQD